MLLPKGRPIHEDLGTAYVKLDHLVRDLIEEGFSGYLKLDNPDFSGVLFFEQGKISGVYTDSPADNPLMTLVKEGSKEGVLNVYSLPTEVVYILATATGGEKIFEDLPMEIINVDGLLSYLSREDFTGTVKIEADGELLLLLLFEGEPVELVYEGVEDVIQGEGVWAKLEEFKTLPQAKLSLFKSVETDRRLQFDPQGIRNSVKSFFQVYISAVEKLLGKGRFGRLFREISLELADEYPFLDPFAPQVILSGTTLDIEEDVSVLDLMEGMERIVREMSRVIKEQKGEKSFNRMVQELKVVLKNEPYMEGFWRSMEGEEQT